MAECQVTGANEILNKEETVSSLIDTEDAFIKARKLLDTLKLLDEMMADDYKWFVLVMKPDPESSTQD